MVWLARLDFPFPVLGLVAGKTYLNLDVMELERRITQHPDQELLRAHDLDDPSWFLSHYLGDEFLFRNRREFQREDLNTIDRPC